MTFVTYGRTLDNVLEAAGLLSAEGVEAGVLRLLTVSNLAAGEILEQLPESRRVVVVEEVCSGSGIREALAWELRDNCPECRVWGLDLGADFVPHGSLKELYALCGLDPESIAAFVRKEVLSG